MLSQNEGKPTCSDMYARKSLPRWYKLVFYIRKEMVVSCFNKWRAGLLFLIQGTGIPELFNSLYRRTIVEKRVAMPDNPETVRQEMREKHTRDIKRDSMVSRSEGSYLENSPVFVTCRK